MSENEITWDDEALAKIEKVPAFVRGMVKGKIEKTAKSMGETRITAELVDKIRAEQE